MADGFFKDKLHSSFLHFLEIRMPLDIHGSSGFKDLMSFFSVKGKKALYGVSNVARKLFVASCAHT